MRRREGGEEVMKRGKGRNRNEAIERAYEKRGVQKS